MDGKAKLIDFGLSYLLNEAEIQFDQEQVGAVRWESCEYLAGERPSLPSDVYSFAICIIEAVSDDLPWGRELHTGAILYRVGRGELPTLPESMDEKQRHLIRLMTKLDPSERVRMAFAVDKLNEIVHDEVPGIAP